MKKLSFLLFLVPATVFGQMPNMAPTAPSVENYVSSAVEFLPPEAASLMKYVDYPVSHLTGIPDIKIPLHTIQIGDLTWPLALSFHIDNYAKVKQLPGTVGSGWSLSNEIQITRDIRGDDDFSTTALNSDNPVGYYHANQYIPVNSTTFSNTYHYGRAYDGTVDFEPDKFYYRLLDKTGSFYFHHAGGAHPVPVSVPHDNGVRIECSYNQNSSEMNFTITDTDGTKYYFGPVSGTKPACDYNSIDGKARRTVSWKCTKITDTQGNNLFSFSYTYNLASYTRSVNYFDRMEIYDTFSTEPIYNGLSSSNPWDVVDEAHLTQGANFQTIQNVPFWKIVGTKGEIFAGDEADRIFWWPEGDTYHKFITCDSLGKMRGNTALCGKYLQNMGPGKKGAKTTCDQWQSLVSSISFSGGIINFSYSNHTDASDFNTDHQLDSLRITSSGNLLKTVKFTHSGRNYARRLDKVQINDMVYKMHYGYQIRRNGSNNATTDFWGYKTRTKGTVDRPNIPTQGINILTGNSELYFLAKDSAVQRRNEPEEVSVGIGAYMRGEIFMIDTTKYTILKMTYPTGGTVEFFVEQNRYKDITNTEKGMGGYRIAEIVYSDAGAVKKKKKFVYEDGTMRKTPDYPNASIADGFGTGHTSQHVEFWYGSGDHREAFNLSPSSQITEKLAVTMRKRTYLQGSIGRMNFDNGSLVYYPTVTEYDMAGSAELGKTVYKYAIHMNDIGNGEQSIRTGTPISPYPLEPDEWNVTYPEEIAKYKKTGNDYTCIYKKEMLYNTEVDYTKIIFRMRLWESTLKELAYTSLGGLNIGDWKVSKNQYVTDFEKIPILTGCLQLMQETTSTWDDEGRLKVDQTFYTYENPHMGVVSKVIRQRSDGETVIEQILYPNDYAGSSATSALITNNIIDKPVERIVYGNSKMISGDLFVYDAYGNPTDIYRLKTDNLAVSAFRLSNKSSAGIFTATPRAAFSRDSRYELEMELKDHDKYNNPRSMWSRTNPYWTTYVWDNIGLYPIAEIKNMKWSNQVPTTIAGLDALRSDNNLQVSTYTYKTGVGMLKATDPRGIATEYSYDAYNRLHEIFYMEGGVKKVLESYDYHYNVKP